MNSDPIPGSHHPAVYQQSTTKPLYSVVLTRQALNLALPIAQLAASPFRGSEESAFVLFDNTEGDPPRQLTIVVREENTGDWEMQMSSEPPVAGVLLVTIGVRTFAARFTDDGTACITHIPVGVLTETNGSDLEIAILPPESTRA